MVCSSPHSHIVCPSALIPHFCIRDLHLPVPVRRRFRLDQEGHASLEPGGSDSLGLSESLCGVVWRWLDQRFSLRVRALPSRGSTVWRKLCLDFSLFLAGSCSYRGMVWFYIALYPVRWTAQSALHFPPLADLFIPTPFSASLGSILAMQQLRNDYSLTFPPLSIARYSFIQLSRLRRREVKENAQTSKR